MLDAATRTPRRVDVEQHHFALQPAAVQRPRGALDRGRLNVGGGLSISVEGILRGSRRSAKPNASATAAKIMTGAIAAHLDMCAPYSAGTGCAAEGRRAATPILKRRSDSETNPPAAINRAPIQIQMTSG